MIGWTKTRKRCPEHGLVLRKHPDEYRNRANFCPACGKQLTVVSVPYLFQVYFHPAIIIIPGILAFFFGLFSFLDVQGCVIESNKQKAIERKQSAIKQQRANEYAEQNLESMPSDWRILYEGMKTTRYGSERWNMLKSHCEQKSSAKMSPMSPIHMKLFLRLLGDGTRDDAFKLIMKFVQGKDK